jgi:tripartite-type tricarboxylate transporter receptor subunit TctC
MRFNTAAKRSAWIAALLLATPLMALAQNYPSKPVTIIHPYPPGGSTDPEARLYASRLQDNLGVPFLVDARPGGGTTIGTAIVAKAAPDGYTLLSMGSSYTIAPLAYPALPYDPIRDIAPIALMSRRSSFIVVPASLPVKNLAEFVAYTKANPGKVNAGTSGAGGVTHLSIEWMLFGSGIKKDVTVVTYKGGGPMFIDLMAGRLQVALGSVLATMPQIKAGKLRAIASSGATRNPSMPDLLTVAEQGVPGYDYAFWMGMGAPGATPPAIINRLSAELIKVARDPSVGQKLSEEGSMEMIGSTPDLFRKHIVAEIARWKKVVADTNFKLEE